MQQVNTIHQLAGHGFLASLYQLALRGANAVSRWNERQKAVRYLYELSDYQLQDLGIHRWEIHSVVNGGMPNSRRSLVSDW